jgi:hypothetical protein
MKRLLIIVITICLLSSCATHTGMISSSPISKGVKYEDIAYGVAQVNKFLGIGGISQDALVLEAKRELMKNRPLRQNEVYINFTVDFKRTYVLLYSQTKVVMSADVVCFLNDTLGEIYSARYKNILNGNLYANELFSIGDSIIDSKFNKGLIISFDNSSVARILYQTKKNKFRTKTISLSKIYSIKKPYKGFKIGSIYSRTLKGTDKVVKLNGKIIALGLNSIIIEDSPREIKIYDYEK